MSGNDSNNPYMDGGGRKRSPFLTAGLGTETADPAQEATEARRSQGQGKKKPAAKKPEAVPSGKSRGGRPRKTDEPTRRFSLVLTVSQREKVLAMASRRQVETGEQVSMTDIIQELIDKA